MQNKWALVTGASSGLGCDFARIHAKEAGHLVIVARREQQLFDLKQSLLAEFPATQISGGSYNDLGVYQAGGGNDAGLYQEASSYNFADISQTIGNNLLEALQVTGGGFNSLTVDQRGGMTASVSQTAATGDNIASVTQIP